MRDDTLFRPFCQKVVKMLRLNATRIVIAKSRRSKITYAVQDASLGIIAMLKIPWSWDVSEYGGIDKLSYCSK